MTYGGTLFEAYWAQHASRLPAGYREVEYIESSGAQWIDTGVYLGEEYSFSLDIDILSVVPATGIFGTFKSGVMYYAYISSPHKKWQVGYGNSFSDNITSVLQGRYVITASGGKFWLNGDLLKDTTGRFATSPDRTALLFNINSASSYNKLIAKFHSLSINDGMALVRSFVPCVRIADSKPGMYDLCGSICGLTNSPFYINAGSGADFTWGELS